MKDIEIITIKKMQNANVEDFSTSHFNQFENSFSVLKENNEDPSIVCQVFLTYIQEEYGVYHMDNYPSLIIMKNLKKMSLQMFDEDGVNLTECFIKSSKANDTNVPNLLPGATTLLTTNLYDHFIQVKFPSEFLLDVSFNNSIYDKLSTALNAYKLSEALPIKDNKLKQKKI